MPDPEQNENVGLQQGPGKLISPFHGPATPTLGGQVSPKGLQPLLWDILGTLDQGEQESLFCHQPRTLWTYQRRSGQGYSLSQPLTFPMSMPRSPPEVEGSRGCGCPLPRKQVEGDIGLEVRAGRKGLSCPRVPVGRQQVAEHPSQGSGIGGWGEM